MPLELCFQSAGVLIIGEMEELLLSEFLVFVSLRKELEFEEMEHYGAAAGSPV